MAKLFLKRTLSGFIGADETSDGLVRKFKIGEIYRAEIVKPRNYLHHKLCFALLSLTYANQERWTDFRKFRRALALAVDYVDEVVTVEGEVVKIPRSLSYDECPDEIEFQKVMPKMMTVCAEILHNMDLKELEEEVARYADEHYGRAA